MVYNLTKLIPPDPPRVNHAVLIILFRKVGLDIRETTKIMQTLILTFCRVSSRPSIPHGLIGLASINKLLNEFEVKLEMPPAGRVISVSYTYVDAGFMQPFIQFP